MSPILANIYLHELDTFMKNMRAQFNEGKSRQANPEYARCGHLVRVLERKIADQETKGGSPDVILALKERLVQAKAKRQSMPSGDPFDPYYRRLRYCRYADDFVIGIIGSKAEAEVVMKEVTLFIEKELKLTIAAEKSGIKHAREGVSFLGFHMRTYSGKRFVRVKVQGTYVTMRTMSE